MNGTRRQSSRLAQPAIKATKPSYSKPSKKSNKRKTHSEAEDDVLEDSGAEDDILLHVSDSDSDTRLAKRPSKRQKSTKAAKSVAKPSRKRKSTGDETCHLTAIPLDVLHEIFNRLEPKDLIQLSRTNHLFRSHLLSKESSGVWRAAREAKDGPDPHADMSEQQWAHLLYGHAQCQSCGARNVQRVDFGLRRRACTKCLKANLVVTSSFKKRFPHLDIKILDFLPYTNIGGFAHGYPSKSHFYWKADIEEMAETVAAYDRDIKQRVAGARQKFEEFSAERTALVEAVVKHAVVCTNWAKELAARRRHEAATKCRERVDLVKQKLLALGWEQEDMDLIQYNNSVSQPTPLTDRVWNKLLVELEPSLRARKAERVAAARKRCVHARTLLVEQVYDEYKKTLVPEQWRFLPGLYEVCQLPAFRAVLDAPSDVDVELAHFDEAAGTLPTFTPAWTAARKAEILRLVPDPREESTSQVQSPQLLNLATTIFQCTQPLCSSPSGIPTVVGWEGAVGHRCTDNGEWAFAHYLEPSSVETVVAFSERGSTAAASLATLAGLDEKGTTADEMDMLDLRFLCLACHPHSINGKDTYMVYSWRLAVSHFVRTPWVHDHPVWHQLNSAETQQMKNDEGPDPTLSWSCKHCSHYLNSYNTFDDVVDHVKTEHGIVNPSAPSDLFCGDVNASRLPIRFTPTLQYHCLKCTSPASKAFDLEVLKAHLQSKHEVTNPVVGTDWKQWRSI
ncbi:hypothetical protein B0H16DRAFT_1372568 [Mycena metata]|uniref:F-box domain-containing protein n=1 Tax=Mycena metata TaxID=1033252 RepID=A0AAD7J0M2_9AGAR|nr:hypothetical protein B0H16DRAFT_1372568 [Mycena metata]